ncbi:hypothetical protein KEM55_006223 [Ascosphaera atra]|nr:hypothetical protein KEM55_006223 [Ascosphaera atra]
MNDKFYLNAVVPYTYFAAVFLFFSYVIGLWFTLRTHAAMIWAVEGEEKKPLHHNEALNQAEPAVQSATPRHRNNPTNAPAIKDTALFNRILSQSLRNVGLAKEEASVSHDPSQEQSGAPPNTTDTAGSSNPSMSKTVKTPLPGLSKDENELFLRHITEVAATAAAIAARDASRIRRPSGTIPTISKQTAQKVHAPPSAQAALVDDEVGAAAQVSAQTGGHDAPNWSKAKSSVILLGATVLYAIIAEILVKTVDVILASVDVEEKFLGITLFALVPNTTEFLVSSTPRLKSLKIFNDLADNANLK